MNLIYHFFNDFAIMRCCLSSSGFQWGIITSTESPYGTRRLRGCGCPVDTSAKQKHRRSASAVEYVSEAYKMSMQRSLPKHIPSGALTHPAGETRGTSVIGYISKCFINKIMTIPAQYGIILYTAMQGE